jgi:DMSO/TMAO reductase YedYZ molybdopterin-dependent catalytic subunit
MGIVSPGFFGRRRAAADGLPPGQYLTEDFPVLSAGPTPHVPLDTWAFEIVDEAGERRTWDWPAMHDLPQDDLTVDLHCVTRWSKLQTAWRGVSLDTLLAEVDTSADFAFITSYGGYTTNLPLEDLRDGKAWLVHTYDGAPLAAEHGGPARLLVPHLYLWKSAKWVRRLTLSAEDELGFWETAGYHAYGDPWREQRYWND